MNIPQYRQDIREKIAELSPMFPDDCCLMMSLTNRDRNSTAGHVCETNVAQAAKLIVENTHRLASSEEISAFKSCNDNEKKRIEQAELKRAGQSLRIIR
jgi:hypothetical protein